MNNDLIEAAKAVIARWDGSNWYTAGVQPLMDDLRQAIAALSAKPEPAKLPEVEEVTDIQWRVSDLIKNSYKYTDTAGKLEKLLNRDLVTSMFREVFDAWDKATAAHAAALIEAEVKGRREALQAVPAEFIARYMPNSGSPSISTYEDRCALERAFTLIESARAAQQEKTK